MSAPVLAFVNPKLATGPESPLSDPLVRARAQWLHRFHPLSLDSVVLLIDELAKRMYESDRDYPDAQSYEALRQLKAMEAKARRQGGGR